MPRSAAPTPPAPTDVTCTLFRGARSKRVDNVQGPAPWEDFVAHILPQLLECGATDKTRLPAFILAPVDGTRSDANVGEHTALVIDVDRLPCTHKAFLAECARYTCAVYESPTSGVVCKSNPDGAFRARVVAALAEPLLTPLVKAARRAFARDLGLDPGAAGVSKADAVSQIMFVGRVDGTPARKMWAFEGEVWAPPADLEAEAERRGGPTSPSHSEGEPIDPTHGPDVVPAIGRKLVSAIEPRKGRQRYGGRDLMRAVGGMLARKGYHPEAIHAAVLDLPSSQPEKRASEAREAAEQWFSGDPRTAGALEVVRHFRDVLGEDDGERVGRRVVKSIDKAARRPGEPEGWIGPFGPAEAAEWPWHEVYWEKRNHAARARHAASKRTEYAEERQAERREVAEARLAEVAPDLVGALETDENGRPYSHASNVGLGVRHYVGHAVARNAATGRPMIVERVVLAGAGGGPDEVLEPGLWADVQTTRLHAAVCRLGMSRPSRSDVNNAVHAIAAEREVWPIRTYLEGLSEWDGKARSLCDYFACERTTYSEWVCAAWLRSCVSRGFRPGAQVDHMLVLEGPQGAAKSSALRLLAGGADVGGWFGEFTAKPGDPQKVGEQLQGKWIVEISELDKWTRTFSSEELKAMLTRRDDEYRTPYDTYPLPHPRTGVFAGSTNRDQYLTDDTGNRRYWPILTGVAGEFDLTGLARDREQLWAQALSEYRAHVDRFNRGEEVTGLEWWPHTPELKALCAAEQARRLVSDAWERAVARWVRDQVKAFTSEDVARHAVGLELERIDARTIARVERCLLACGCERTETKRGLRAWRKP